MAKNITYTFRFDHLVTLEMSKVKTLRTWGSVQSAENVQWSYDLKIMGESLFEGNDLLLPADQFMTASEAAVIALAGLVDPKNHPESNRRQKAWFANAADHYTTYLYDMFDSAVHSSEDIVSEDKDGNEYIAVTSLVKFQV